MNPGRCPGLSYGFASNLRDAYEYLIGQFAAGSGKKAGEPERSGDSQPQAARRANQVRQFYTPQQIGPSVAHNIKDRNVDSSSCGFLPRPPIGNRKERGVYAA